MAQTVPSAASVRPLTEPQAGRGAGRHVAAVLLTAGLVLLAGTGERAQLTAILLSGLAPAAIAVHRLASRERRSRTWLALAVGTSLLVVHDLQALLALALTGTPAAGALYATTLNLGYAAIVTAGLMALRPVWSEHRGSTLDAAIVAVGAAAVLWVTLLEPVQVTLGVSTGEVRMRLVQLVVVCVLLALILRVGALLTGARGGVAALAVAVAAALAGNLAVMLTVGEQPAPQASWLGAVWVVANVALAGGLIHPSSPLATVDRADARLSPRRLVFLGAALALAPTMSAAQVLAGEVRDPVLLTLAALALVPLVTARIADLARRHEAAEERLLHLTLADDLTGLPNRRATSATLVDLVDRARAGTSPGGALLFCDLDDFKVVNDRHGHPVGDRLLVAVADRLRAAVPAGGLVARFGGDEFVVLLEGEPATAQAAAVAAVERALEGTFDLVEVTVRTRASIGATAVEPGASVEQLLSRADSAMYEVKRTRRAGTALPVVVR